MFLTGLGTAAPAGRFTQLECWDALQKAPQFPKLHGRSQALLRKVLSGDNGISTRRFVMEKLADVFDLTPDALHARFSEHAPRLATEAAARALAMAGLQPTQIDAVIISTCTGYLCPGLTSYVTERLGLRADVHALDLVGQGCGAAMPNLRTGEALIAAGRAQHVLSVCVEICSAAFYLDDDPGVLVSACLFGDGAAAAVLSREAAPGVRRVEWKTCGTLVSTKDRDTLRFEQRHGMLRNILDRKVPALAAMHAENVLNSVLQSHPLDRSEIGGWILHAGGREVLASLQRRLNLADDDVRPSAEVLLEYGNVSSPFVLFALERALAQNAPGGWWWMSSFGAGFSCHGALLRVDENDSRG